MKELHKNFYQLVACYLIYRNASREELCAQARDFGVDVTVPPPENPLRYWIVYVIALIASVYVGVYASALTYDWLSGQGFNIADYPDRALTWAMYASANYGVAIIAILLLRFVARSLGNGLHQSHLIMYCWTFLVVRRRPVRTGDRRPLLRIRAPIRRLVVRAGVLRDAQMGLGPGAGRRLHLVLPRSADLP